MTMTYESFLWCLIVFLLFLMLKYIFKYIRLLDKISVKTVMEDSTIIVKVNPRFNYSKYYPLIMTELKKAIDDANRLKMLIRFNYDGNGNIYMRNTSNQILCDEFVNRVKNIIEKHIYREDLFPYSNG